MTTINAEQVQCGECKLYRRVDESVTICDICQITISYDDYPYLTTTAFNEGANTSYDYCSWKCAFAHLRVLEADHFLGLPSIMFNEDNPKTNKEAFLTELRNFK